LKKKDEIDNPIVDTSYYKKGSKSSTKPKKKLSQKEQERLLEERRERREELKRQKEEQDRAKRRHIKFIFVLLFIMILFAIGAFIYTNHTNEARVVRKYYNLLEQKKYDEMYDLVITDLSKEDFIARNKNIYDGVQAKDISCVITANSKANTNTAENIEQPELYSNVSYRFDMSTIAGNITFNNTIKVKTKDGSSKINWDSSMIFPGLKNDEKVRINTLKARRGYIYDRNNVTLAKEGKCYNVGIVPDKTDSSTDYGKLAKLLDISESTIKEKCKSDYVGVNTFVPLKLISAEEQDLKSQLLTIKGVMVSEETCRVYPYNESTSILLGYVQDEVGKSGIEAIYNDRLAGKNGVEIYKEKDGKKLDIIQKQDYINGEDVKLTIDSKLQQLIYNTYSQDKGASVLMNYETGEILALVSFPSFNSNQFSLGFSSNEWKNIESDPKKPLFNRFTSTYTPGSSIKPIVGAIGIDGNYFTSEEDFGTSGYKWQPDKSWKDLYITTTETYSGKAILQNALIYSDNIYFAKAGLKIGQTNMTTGLNKFGFNEKINVGFDLTESSFGTLNSDKLLAQTSYGQGELMVNPIHMAMMYSVFTKDGNMIKPYIEYKLDKTPTYYKSEVISAGNANIIKQGLLQVVLQGTAKECIIEGTNIYGKTGTAEIKKDQQDKNGTENGWFCAFDDDSNLIVSVVEDVKGRGGSHYVVRKTKEIFEEL